MATYNGVNKTKTVSVPSVKLPPGELNGRLKWAYDEYTFGAEITSGEDIALMTIPNGARIVDAIVTSPDLGATVAFSLGYTGDLDALMAGIAPNGAAITDRMSDTVGAAAQFEKLTADKEILLSATATSVAATGLTVKVGVAYIAD